ncbi:hypothetical protein SJAG_05312 [Schizosaccharomyces japonicus yFS275]|uniref:Uncharacterized protein n=1 Tax=Schizosaccharomyces japonicus (strain yFS275 / FY16936) TaxID=402676 RepID=B6K515_SCHJY|nr:hypothetical protein SJAG_05312 [Schizosaccharomyces japonicus yFS275]EEB08619.1 hypothetical protein SJAG_05312 [Schizosaccharomyces japonicus yFS275]
MIPRGNERALSKKPNPWERLRKSTRFTANSVQEQKRKSVIEQNRGGTTEMSRVLDEAAYLEWKTKLEGDAERHSVNVDDLDHLLEEFESS